MLAVHCGSYGAPGCHLPTLKVDTPHARRGAVLTAAAAPTLAGDTNEVPAQIIVPLGAGHGWQTTSAACLRPLTPDQLEYIWSESFGLRDLLEGGPHMYTRVATKDDAWVLKYAAGRNQLLRDAGVPVPRDPATALEVRCVQSAPARLDVVARTAASCNVVQLGDRALKKWLPVHTSSKTEADHAGNTSVPMVL